VIFSSLLLIISPLAYLYDGCSNKKYGCEIKNFISVSGAMGQYPNDKYFEIFMIFFVCLQFQSFRAQYLRFSDIIPVWLNVLLFLIGIVGLICGPMLVYYDDYKLPDRKERSKLHLFYTWIYIVALAIYMIACLLIMNFNPNQFPNCTI
jgi:hypothetical protein